MIHVIDPDIPEALWQAQNDQVRTEIWEALARVASYARERARIEILSGRPNTEVAVYATRIKGCLVILGYPRVSESGTLSFASFAGRILRAAVAPVLVVKARGNDAYRRAIVTSQLSLPAARSWPQSLACPTGRYQDLC